MPLEDAVTETGEKYKLERELGRGGQGNVFICSTGNLVKICKHATKLSLRNLIREFQSMPKQVKGFFSVPQQLVKSGTQWGYIMPYQAKCVPLKDALAPLEPQKWENWHIQPRDLKHRFLISYRIAQAMAALHGGRYIYRDLSARNILIAEDATNTFVRIIDVDNIAPVGQSKSLLITKAYSAPELMRAGQSRATGAVAYHNYNTDNYSLAVILFKFLLGKAHPLIGDLVSADAVKREENAYLGKARYILDDPNQESISKEGELKMKKLADALIPYHLQQLFHKTFVEGLNLPDERPTALDFTSACFDAANQVYFCPHCKCGYVLQIPQDITPLGGHTSQQVHAPISLFPHSCPHCGDSTPRKAVVIGDMVYPKIARKRPEDKAVSDNKPHKWFGRQLRYIFPIQNSDIVLAKKYIKPTAPAAQFEDGVCLFVRNGKIYFNRTQSVFNLYYQESQIINGKQREVWHTVSHDELLPINKNIYFEQYANDYEYAERFMKVIEE